VEKEGGKEEEDKKGEEDGDEAGVGHEEGGKDV